MIDKISQQDIDRAEKIMINAFDKAFPIKKTEKDQLADSKNFRILLQTQLQMAAETVALRAALDKSQPMKDTIQREMEKMVALVMECIKKTALKGKENGKTLS